MECYSGWQYLLIDCANQFGLDKLLFEERIAWTEAHLHELESLVSQAASKTRPLYLKAVMAIRKAQKGEATGHMVGFDACCSGIQIMSAITGCEDGARATGLIDPNVRADAYSCVTTAMNEILHQHGISVDVTRKQAKDATMTTFYGSKLKPMEIFGEDTPELSAFYQAACKVAPGAWDLLQTLLEAWQPWVLYHAWQLPDGYDARVKVMEKQEARIEVDELDHATFTYEFYVNQGSKKGISLPANVVHSIDAYVLRSMHRRCNYDPLVLWFAHEAIQEELCLRASNGQMEVNPDMMSLELSEAIARFKRTNMVDAAILPHLLNPEAVWYLSDDHLERLETLCANIRSYPPFPLVTVHDEFKCHANHMNRLRYWYKEILAELAESEILSDILSQIHQIPGTFPKLTPDLGAKIRESNYALS